MPRKKRSRSKRSAIAKHRTGVATFEDRYLHSPRPTQGRRYHRKLSFPFDKTTRSMIGSRDAAQFLTFIGISDPKKQQKSRPYMTRPTPKLVPFYSRICANRKKRKELLFRRGKVGKGIRIPRRRKTEESFVKCS